MIKLNEDGKLSDQRWLSSASPSEWFDRYREIVTLDALSLELERLGFNFADEIPFSTYAAIAEGVRRLASTRPVTLVVDRSAAPILSVLSGEIRTACFALLRDMWRSSPTTVPIRWIRASELSSRFGFLLGGFGIPVLLSSVRPNQVFDLLAAVQELHPSDTPAILIRTDYSAALPIPGVQNRAIDVCDFAAVVSEIEKTEGGVLQLHWTRVSPDPDRPRPGAHLLDRRYWYFLKRYRFIPEGVDDADLLKAEAVEQVRTSLRDPELRDRPDPHATFRLLYRQAPRAYREQLRAQFQHARN